MRKQLRFDEETRNVLTALGLSTPRGARVRFDEAHADAGESLFILQELQAIEQQLYETPFGPLKSDILIPFAMDIPAGAQEWGYDRVTPFGLAQWISADAKDLPRANVKRERVTFPINSMGISYSYTRQDLMSALMANMPLEALEARAARRGIDSFRDKTLIEGDASVGFSGFINDPSVTSGNAAFLDWTGGGATPDQIIQDVNNHAFAIVQTTKEVYWPDTLAVPVLVYGHMTTTPRSANSDTTIWEYIQKNNPYLKNLEMLQQLGLVAEGGLSPGAGTTRRAIMYKRDPEVVVAKIAIAFEQLPPQLHGFAIDVPCWGRIGGTHWRVPIAALYIDGV